MNKFLLVVLTAASLLGAQTVQANQLSLEESALLLNENCERILADQKIEVQNKGLLLRIYSVETLDLSKNKFIYVNLMTKNAADIAGQWEALGAVVGKVVYGPMGEIGFDGIYFQPAPRLPGGSSVGNH